MEESAYWEAASSSASKQFSRHWTRRFITAFRRARHVSLSWARSTHSKLHPTSWWYILVLFSHQRLGLPKGLFSSVFPILKLLYNSHAHLYVPHTLTISFPVFGKLGKIIWTAQNINLLINQHLPLVLPVCSLPDSTCTYHVLYATGSTVPLAMSKQTFFRTVDDSEVCRSVASVSCKRIDCCDKSSDM
jgi:hypothetical protein